MILVVQVKWAVYIVTQAGTQEVVEGLFMWYFAHERTALLDSFVASLTNKFGHLLTPFF